MKAKILLLALLICVAVIVTGNSLASSSGPLAQEKESLKEPGEIVLCQGCSDGDSPFNHTNHATKNYSPDGTAVLACVECHHTDQPAAALKPPYKLSERDAALTSAMLKVAGAKAVKACKACHFVQAEIDDDASLKQKLPSVTYAGDTKPTILNDKEANHRNCETCHTAAIKARPTLKDKVPPSDSCKPCHKP